MAGSARGRHPLAVPALTPKVPEFFASKALFLTFQPLEEATLPLALYFPPAGAETEAHGHHFTRARSQ